MYFLHLIFTHVLTFLVGGSCIIIITIIIIIFIIISIIIINIIITITITITIIFIILHHYSIITWLICWYFP
jgi:hypothetical protein